MKENSSFISFENQESGILLDEINHESYPIAYYNIVNGRGFQYSKGCSYYGYVYSGYPRIIYNGHKQFNVSEGTYFSFSNPFSILGIGGVIIIEVYHKGGLYPQTNFKAMNTIGLEIEDKGRLKYIDGCTDSLLIPPVKMGDPCLNHLHFPKGIDQTPHTHPSHRIGIVARGYGECITPFGNLPLTEGMIFVIKEWDGETYDVGLDGKEYPIGTHSFKTTDSEMDVIAFHPDSDFGATDIDHPMINRTIVDGISANRIDSIRTK